MISFLPLCSLSFPWSPWDTSSTPMASSTSYASVARLGLSPKCHPSLQGLSALRSHGASSSPRNQTVSSPPLPGPLLCHCPPLKWGPSSSRPDRTESPWTEPSSPFIRDTWSVPKSCPPPCLTGFAHSPVSPDQLPLFSVSQDRPTLTPVPAFCESHLRPVLPTPGRPVLSPSCIKWSFQNAVRSRRPVWKSPQWVPVFSFENSADVHGSSGLALYLCLQCDLLAATHSLSMYDARVMHTVLMQCVNSGM